MRKIFKEIGTPEKTVFTPDDFQLEALEKIKETDVLVSAPTGSGKTWIAVEAMKRILAEGKRAWYASPLKALSNSKFHEFEEEFGCEQVGILTGDRKENTHASIIVGTTEILRNQLYDAMEEGIDLKADLVILDEAHFLGDSERGVVWEEVMIYLPARVRLLMLSATIQNDQEIAGWLAAIRKHPCHVVHTEKRPVPIFPLYLFPSGEIVPLSSHNGITPKIRDFLQHTEKKSFRRSSVRLPFGKILNVMETFNLLPAIFFLKSRDECNNAILSCLNRSVGKERKLKLQARLAVLLDEYPFLAGHPQLPFVINQAVGAHHGGQLPHWKIVIEKLKNEGYLDAIFSTSTVAAGVNFPARTVVLVQSDRFNGKEFVNLTATDLHQAIGRAGRRGKDRIGFALMVHGPFQDPRLMDQLLDSPPEPIHSQIKINFSMALNLLLSHHTEEIKELLQVSFATFQNIERLKTLEDNKNSLMRRLLQKMEGCHCQEVEDILHRIQKRSDGFQLLAKMKRKKRFFSEAIFKESQVVKGRLFLDRKGGFYCALGVKTDNRDTWCECLKIHGPAGGKNKHPRPIKLPLDQIGIILDGTLAVHENMDAKQWAQITMNMHKEEFNVLPYPDNLTEDQKVKLTLLSAEIDALKKELTELPCNNCSHFALCHQGKKTHFKKLVDKVRRAGIDLHDASNALWREFERHLHFLQLHGFADSQGRLTSDGVWAAKLRLDQPLMIAELIRKGLLNELTPELLSGVIAPFVNDKFRDVEISDSIGWEKAPLRRAFFKMQATIDTMAAQKKKYGFNVSIIQFWPAAALYIWSCGKSWEEVIRLTSVDEGDLAMLIFRTADNLRQIVALEGTHPTLAKKARRAIELILREPVIVPT